MSHASLFRSFCLASVILMASASAQASPDNAAAPEPTKAAEATAATDAYVLTLKNHVFSPEKLTIPADKEVTLTVKNEDATAEEFESESLDREKVIAAGAEVKINVGPLKPGSYEFKGEYHEDSAKGQIVVE